MTPQLKGLLTRSDVSQVVIDQLEKDKCFEVGHFAKWVDSTAELVTCVLQPLGLKDDMPQKARLKLAWSEAEALHGKMLKRSAEGLEPIDPDEPLDKGTADSLQAAWQKAHNWPALASTRICTDAILGRTHREFMRYAPTIFPVMKVKSLANAQKGGKKKRQRLAPGLDLELLDVDEGEQEGATTFLDWLELLEMLGNTWSVAGAFDVRYEGEVQKFVTWPQADKYIKEVKKRASTLLGKFTESSVIDFITNREEALRMEAMELCRSDAKVPWGKALTSVLKDFNHVWQEERQILVAIGMSQPNRGRQADPPPSNANAGKGKGKGKGKDKGGKSNISEDDFTSAKHRKKWATGRQNEQGKDLCKFYNDTRGCKTPCPQKKVHACDVYLATGKICGHGGHRRIHHDEKVHGMPWINRK